MVDFSKLIKPKGKIFAEKIVTIDGLKRMAPSREEVILYGKPYVFNGECYMRTDRVEDIEEIRLAMTVKCSVCKADIDCACDQFLAPHPLPFTVHLERLEAACRAH